MAARLILAACLLAACATGATASASEPPPAYRAAAARENVPATVLFAVALQESGTEFRGRVRPWPWTLNVAGEAHRYSTRRQACYALRQALLTTPAVRIDVGLGQINLGYHGYRVPSACDLLNPYRNLAIAAAILREQHASSNDWLVAIGRYHRPAGGELAEAYRQSVQRHHLRAFGTASTSALAGGMLP